MQLVIDIDEKTIEAIKNEDFFINLGRSNGKTILCNIINAIETATPLPKGHGRLIDENKLKKEAIRCEWSRSAYDMLDHTLSYMKPIIDADKESD